MEYLVDTGILLRLFERNDPHHLAIRRAIRILARRGDRMVTTVQNIAEFWNVSTRPASARGGYGHSLAQVQRRVPMIERLCEVLVESNSSYQLWKALVADHSVSGAAVHDARLVSIMNEHGITHLLTLNSSDFLRYSVSAVAPEYV